VLDSILVYLGLALILAGLVSLIRPIRFLYIRTRLVAAMVIAAGVFLGFIAGDMLDSFLVYLGLALLLAGLLSLIWPIPRKVSTGSRARHHELPRYAR
jgi:hypothetical protein